MMRHSFKYLEAKRPSRLELDRDETIVRIDGLVPLAPITLPRD